MTIYKNEHQHYDIPDSFNTGINKYTVDNSESLGVGGNAAVYECTDRQGNIRAVKFLLNLSQKSRDRFDQEVKLLQRLDHPHITHCFDCGEVIGVHTKTHDKHRIPFLIMERADMNIVGLMKMTEGINYDVYAPQIRGLADALNHLHMVAIHRDIKPENILVRGETWMLSDFGLCTAISEDERLDITRTQERIGPKYWLSPEAANRTYFGVQEIDTASDVYQLCAVFWFIITRRYPLGIIENDDYSEFDSLVCRELLNSLKYNKNRRAQDGKALYDSICKATINREV